HPPSTLLSPLSLHDALPISFQDEAYKFGSLAATDPAARRKAIDHHLHCLEVMDATGSRDLKIWLADGTNYPGQGDLRARQDALRSEEHTSELQSRFDLVCRL